MTEAALTVRIRVALEQPPLSQISAPQRAELLEALSEADTFEDLPGKWQAALLAAESGRPHGGCGHGRA